MKSKLVLNKFSNGCPRPSQPALGPGKGKGNGNGSIFGYGDGCGFGGGNDDYRGYGSSHGYSSYYTEGDGCEFCTGFAYGSGYIQGFTWIRYGYGPGYGLFGDDRDKVEMGKFGEYG